MTIYTKTSPLHQALHSLRQVLGTSGASDKPSLSLAPDRQHSTPPAMLCEYLLREESNSRLIECFAQGIGRTVQTQALHFPDNIFGDLDFLAADLLSQARNREEDALTYLERAFNLIAELNGLFGVHSPIRFCYAHDFLYGFDWSRWVRRQPLERRAYSPFSLEFLTYLKHRGGELLELIRRDDAKYPALPAGQLRNVFPFSREPDDEVQLHQSLACDHLIPVPAWDSNAAPRWDFDCNKTRRLRAADLGIAAASNCPELTTPHGEG